MISQLGITLALVSLGWVGSSLNFKTSLNEGQSNKLWGILIFLVIVLLATIFSGVLPKALVLNRPEAAALRLAPLLEVCRAVVVENPKLESSTL